MTDTTQVLRTIDSVVQSIQPEKRDKRRLYFAEIASQHFLPSGDGTQPMQEVIANHATKTFHAWAEQFAMPPGDSSVALSVLGKLANVTTADKTILNDVPIRNASKEMITRFFGTEKAAMESHEDIFTDDIDDSELLECPDLSTYNASFPTPQRSYLHASTNHQPLDSGYYPNTYGAGTSVSGIVHRDHNLFSPPGSISSNIQSLQNDIDQMHAIQYIHQGHGRHNYPSPAMYRTNQFM